MTLPCVQHDLPDTLCGKVNQAQLDNQTHGLQHDREYRYGGQPANQCPVADAGTRAIERVRPPLLWDIFALPPRTIPFAAFTRQGTSPRPHIAQTPRACSCMPPLSVKRSLRLQKRGGCLRQRRDLECVGGHAQRQTSCPCRASLCFAIASAAACALPSG